MSTRRSKIKAFDTFGKALSLLEANDSVLYTWPRNRIALSHALAEHIRDLISESDKTLSVDLCPMLSRSGKTLNPDILVHDRASGHQVLSVACRNEYLTENEQDELIRFRRESKCELVLALRGVLKASLSDGLHCEGVAVKVVVLNPVLIGGIDQHIVLLCHE